MDIHEANEYGKQMILQYLPGSDWKLRWDRAPHRAGMADFKNGRIVLSVTAVEQYSDEQVEQLMLHEIAHVLAGPKSDHGKAWKDAGKSIGYVGGKHCDDFADTRKGLSFGGWVAVASALIALYTVVFPLGIIATVVLVIVLIVKVKKQFNTVEQNIGLEMDEEGEWV